MPCDYRILQSSTKEQVLLVLLETVQRSQNTKHISRKQSYSLLTSTERGLSVYKYPRLGIFLASTCL